MRDRCGDIDRETRERREETQADMRKQPLLDDAKTKHITGKPKTSNKLAL